MAVERVVLWVGGGEGGGIRREVAMAVAGEGGGGDGGHR